MTTTTINERTSTKSERPECGSQDFIVSEELSHKGDLVNENGKSILLVHNEEPEGITIACSNCGVGINNSHFDEVRFC